MVLEQVDPLDDLRVPDDEAEPPPGHPVRLGHREHLDADLLRAVVGEEALRRAAVEDEVAVGEVVDDRRAVPLGPGDRGREDAGRRSDRAGVRREVEVGGARGARRVEVRCPAGRFERQRAELGARERDTRRVVRVARVGQQDPLAMLREDEAELDERRLRPGHDRHLARGVELDAVDVAVPRGDGLLELGHAPELRVAVRALVRDRALRRLDHVRGRADLGVAPSEVDERLAVLRRLGGDASEQRGEVLLRQPLEPVGTSGGGYDSRAIVVVCSA